MSLVCMLSTDALTLTSVDSTNVTTLERDIAATGDEELLSYLHARCLPFFEVDGRQLTYGFSITFDRTFVGLTLLGVSNWHHAHGYIETHIAAPHRGNGFGPRSKAPLFHFAFLILDLNRVEMSCAVTNTASQRALAKTPGVVYEGRIREYVRKADGVFEDEYRHSIIRRDWERLYDRGAVSVVHAAEPITQDMTYDDDA